MKINLNIDRLVLKGLPSSLSDSRVIQRTIEHEVSALLQSRAVNSLPLSKQNRNLIKPENIHIDNHTTSTRIGKQVAGSIVRGLEK